MDETRKYRIRPGHKVDWEAVDPDEKGSFSGKDDLFQATEELIGKIDVLQERLYAEHQRSLLIVLQALDTGGKDGTIRHVMRGVNPQGCQVTSFKVPNEEEKSHDFLWRVHRQVPPKGYIGIFNRSHYEDVTVTRVHKLIPAAEAERRCTAINDFERLLFENGTTILKFFLAISREEQRNRLQARLDDPEKRWKFSASDLTERKYWDRYPKAYGAAISATSTKHAPWYIIPANHKTYRNYLVAKIVLEALEEMNPQYPSGHEGIDYRNLKIPE